MKQGAREKTVFLIDGSSFLYRAYYGVRPMHTTAGAPVQAIYSFCRMMKKLIAQCDPAYLVLTWDAPGKTARHILYSAYKATRQAAPSDLVQQKMRIQEFARLIGICQVEQPGIEADDIMYSLALDCVQADKDVVLVTADKDMAQMVTDRITIYDWFAEGFLDIQVLEKKFGFSVAKLPFYYALVGDSSDNIPGVKGVGKVMATQLVQQFDSLADLYARIDIVEKERVRALLLAHKEDAFLSEQLFLLRYYNFDFSVDMCVYDPSLWVNAKPLFQELEFTSLLKEFEAQHIGVVVQPLSARAGYTFVCVQEASQLMSLIYAIREAGVYAFDTETDGLNSMSAQLVGISIAIQSGTAYYIPFGHVAGAQLSRDMVLAALRPVFEDVHIKKYAHHAKFDMHMLANVGMPVHGLMFDTMIAAHLVTKDWQRVGLKYLSEFYLHEQMDTFSDVVSKNGYAHFGFVPVDMATEYAAADAHQTLRLVPILQQLLAEQVTGELFEQVEMPLVPVLHAMERAGIACDVSVLLALDKFVVTDLSAIEQKIRSFLALDREQLNLNSPKQLEKLLFTDLQLPPQKKTKKGYSTDQEVLEVLAKIHPVPGLIITYRELFKLKSTYIDALPTYVHTDGRIHTNFSQTSVATGRLSSSDPNMQNIPTATTYDIHVRGAFVAREDHVFLSADYSQIELRVLAYLSQDEALLRAFAQTEDIHAVTAAKLYDVPLQEVTSEQRQMGKRINFSILYGLTPYGLSQDLGIPFAQAKIYIEKYFAQYPGVTKWMALVLEQTKEHGYVTTLFGRRRYLPGIYEKNKTLYDLACRMAINTRAQGTAAELMKKGMLQVHALLSNQKAYMLLQIHDELLIEVHREHVDAVRALVKQTLEQVVDWNVPLVVDVRVGRTWQDVTK